MRNDNDNDILSNRQYLTTTPSPPLVMSSQLRHLTTTTLKTAGLFTWALSCAWLYQEYVYDWMVRNALPPSLPQPIIPSKHR